MSSRSLTLTQLLTTSFDNFQSLEKLVLNTVANVRSSPRFVSRTTGLLDLLPPTERVVSDALLKAPLFFTSSTTLISLTKVESTQSLGTETLKGFTSFNESGSSIQLGASNASTHQDVHFSSQTNGRLSVGPTETNCSTLPRSHLCLSRKAGLSPSQMEFQSRKDSRSWTTRRRTTSKQSECCSRSTSTMANLMTKCLCSPSLAVSPLKKVSI